ncbi:AI-2E family transporter [Microvirga lenta]|uniref:AI-2E family transporter n=1 Tax=Microvirga lenta TaxID=2881337 RepID=UPI001CFFED44|nr:AI-2E family transporter [Microvirga lenta]MCB5177523.1 AI-2E family transporter [Microvirga lenta]
MQRPTTAPDPDSAGTPDGRDDQNATGPKLTGAVAVSIHVCAIVLGTGALYFAKPLILPIIIGLLTALTLIPIVRWLERRGVPTGLSAIMLVLLLALTLGTGAYLLSAPVSDWIQRAPTIGRQVEDKLNQLRGSVQAVTEASQTVEELTSATSDPQVQEVVVKEAGFLSSATSILWSALTTTGIALVLVLFLLGSGDMIYDKIVRVLPTFRDKRTAVSILHDIEASISHYLLTITLINMGLGIAIGLAMWAIGLPTPYLWGLGATFLNFLPFIGAIAGVGLVAVVALISFDSISYALLAPLVYFGLTALEGNIITPLILGRRLELNTVAIFIGVAFWGWVWGLVGVLIAVPLLVVIKRCCDHLPSWSTLGEFLSLTPPKSEVEAEQEQPDLNPVAKT